MLREANGLKVRSVIYVVSGICSIIFNLIIAVVILSNRTLKKKMILHFFLSIGNGVNGISYLVCGIGYLGMLADNAFTNLITPWECLVTKPWPIIALYAGELPVITHFLISLELFIATFRPGIYRRYWRSFYKMIFGLSPWVFSSISLFSAFLSAARSTSRGTKTYEMCHLFDACGEFFGTGHMLGMALLYFLSSLLACCVFIKAVQVKATNPIDTRRHAVVVALNFFAFFLIAIPYVLIVLNGWSIISLTFGGECTLYSTYIYTSVINLPVYLSFRRDFWQQFLKVTFIRRNAVQSSINTSGFTQTRVIQVKSVVGAGLHEQNT
uniref:G_PROTEIN_RECEP_F1_2 domain-containing protein n=1 Tax=Syphacia muris TaxID=451379 RepID=A0A0N5A7N6_9BILA